MKVYINRKYRHGFFLVILLLFFSVKHVNAEEENELMIGYISSDFISQDEDNTYCGYGYDYLQEIAKYTGWNYRYVKLSMADGLDALKRGNIDIFLPLVYTKDRAKEYSYPDIPIGNCFTVLYMDQDNQEIYYNDYDSFNHKVVGMLKGSYFNTSFEELCRNQGIQAEKRYYDTEEDMKKALEQGDISIMVSTNLVRSSGFKIIAKFGITEFYFVTGKKDSSVLTKLNEALSQINLNNPFIEQQLYNKYFSSTRSSNLTWTKQEQKYMNQDNLIRVAVLPSNEPIQYFDEKTNEFKGITADIYSLITEKTGLIFSFIQVDTEKEALDLVEKHEVDIVSNIISDYSFANEADLILSEPYLEDRVALVKRDQLSQGKNQGMLALTYREPLLKDLENFFVIRYNDLTYCLDAVNNGDADFTYANVYVIEKLLEEYKYKNLSFSSVSNIENNICMGYVNSADSRMIAIIDKVIQSISEEEKQKIIFNNTLSNDTKITLSDLITEHPIVIIVAVTTCFVIIIIIIIVFVRIKINNQKYLTQKALMEEERYRVATELANDILFEYDIVSDIMRNSEKFFEFFGRYHTVYHYTEYMLEKNYIYEEDQGVFEEYCQALHFGKEMIEAEYRVLDRKNEYVWCHIRGKTIYNSDNRPIKVIGKLVNVDIQKRELEALIHKAQRDPLTNVYNKGATQELIEEWIQNSKPHEKHVLMLIDIDNFKGINDEYGHLLGDKVLTGVMSHVTAMFREEDIVGRIGGDEFVIFMKNVTNREQIEMKGKLLCEAFHNTIKYEEVEIAVSGSIGISIYPLHGSSYNELLEKADKALYQVKNQGKNSYSIYLED